MTVKQLEQEVRNKFKAAESLLQMPPVLKPMEDTQRIIAHDPALSHFSENSFVFTDVSFGLKNADRSVVIRHPDGVLEAAPFDVRKRVYQIYFPMAGRKFREPQMFTPENLKRLMNEGEYEFVLDKACLQFEPDEQRFHEITSLIYQHINENQSFDKLRSTRHFGPMSFFLAWHKIIDDLVLDMIRNDYLKNAVELICLMYKLNAIEADTSILKTLAGINETERLIQSIIDQLLKREEIKKIEKTNEDLSIDELCFSFIQDSFVKSHSLKKPQLESALQTYKERHNELKNIAAGVN
jgi:small subunit ribosomal protein S22